jgi:hypothetical protein
MKSDSVQKAIEELTPCEQLKLANRLENAARELRRAAIVLIGPSPDPPRTSDPGGLHIWAQN